MESWNCASMKSHIQEKKMQPTITDSEKKRVQERTGKIRHADQQISDAKDELHELISKVRTFIWVWAQYTLMSPEENLFNLEITKRLIKKRGRSGTQLFTEHETRMQLKASFGNGFAGTSASWTGSWALCFKGVKAVQHKTSTDNYHVSEPQKGRVLSAARRKGELLYDEEAGPDPASPLVHRMQ